MQRLDKVLVSQGVGSRKEVSRLIREGRVRIGDAPVTDPAAKLDPETDPVFLDGSRIDYRPYLYILLHKPAGVLSASEDRRQTTVLDLLPPSLKRRGLFPAGRLDKDTTGLLLITDDGDFAHRMLSPKSGVIKRYRAELLRPVTPEDVAAFAAGVTEGGERFAPAVLSPEPGSRALVEVTEGKFHEVKRLFAATGNRVTALMRVSVGGLLLPEDLPMGEARLLTKEEANRVFL